MKKNIFTALIAAFLISLLIHFLIFDVVNKKIADTKLSYPTTNKEKKETTKKGYSNIKFVKIKQETPPQETPKEKKPTINKEVKKILKPSPVIQKQQITAPNPIQLPEKQQPDLKKFFTISSEEKKRIEEQKQRKKEQVQKIYNEIDELKKLDRITQSYIKLYGEKYFALSDEQKLYLKNNLSRIGMITQRYLSYPGLSIKTRQSGINVIEFTLHPNGDISNLRITDSSNYTALDKNTIETIELAYKEYPKPTEPTQIKIYVRYILY